MSALDITLRDQSCSTTPHSTASTLASSASASSIASTTGLKELRTALSSIYLTLYDCIVDKTSAKYSNPDSLYNSLTVSLHESTSEIIELSGLADALSEVMGQGPVIEYVATLTGQSTVVSGFAVDVLVQGEAAHDEGMSVVSLQSIAVKGTAVWTGREYIKCKAKVEMVRQYSKSVSVIGANKHVEPATEGSPSL